MSKPRPYTAEEARDLLLQAIRDMVTYWDVTAPGTLREKMEGLAYTFCAALDGRVGTTLPRFEIRPIPHPSDRAYHKSEGENWFRSKGALSPLSEQWKRPSDPAPSQLMMEKPRAWTLEETRLFLLEHFWGLIDYWEKVEGYHGPKTSRDRIEGLAFSLCSSLDGGQLDLPAFEVRPAYAGRKKGENWFPVKVDIGPLHEHFYRPKEGA